LVVSLLVSVTVTLDVGADGSVTVNVAVPPSATDVLVGSPIAPALVTVTLPVASAMYGVLLAWITVLPADAPVTGRVAVL
jgi:hypothetical protein